MQLAIIPDLRHDNTLKSSLFYPYSMPTAFYELMVNYWNIHSMCRQAQNLGKKTLPLFPACR